MRKARHRLLSTVEAMTVTMEAFNYGSSDVEMFPTHADVVFLIHSFVIEVQLSSMLTQIPRLKSFQFVTELLTTSRPSTSHDPREDIGI